jgi:anthranilate synthase component 1
MHIVSNVEGRLRPDRSAYDVMRATFPAGTVSGSPKVRAMQVINEIRLHSRRRVQRNRQQSHGHDGRHRPSATRRRFFLAAFKAA